MIINIKRVMYSNTVPIFSNSEEIKNECKLDIKNIALKAPKKTNCAEQGFWKRMFWIEIPKRENISNIRKEYSQVMKEMQKENSKDSKENTNDTVN